MAEDDTPPDEAPEEGAEDGDGEDGDAGGKKAKRRKLLIFGGAGLAVLLVVAGAAMLLLGGDDDTGQATVELAGPPVFHELPELLADLKTGRCRAPYLKVKIVVEIPQNQVADLEAKAVEIIDALQAELRETERQALVGKAGTEQLRERLLLQINGLIAPAQARGILFREFLLQ